MLNTTFRLAHKANACISSYRKMAEALGGIRKYGEDTPIPLSKVVEVCGLDDAIWALRCTLEPSEKFLIKFACKCAEHTLINFEKLYPNDKRPRQAIEAALGYAEGKVTLEELRSAASAAWAAWSAAWSAESAEREWQAKTFLELLSEA